jgi:hypothetical protein
MARKRIRLPRLSARASASGVSSFNSGSARKAARAVVTATTSARGLSAIHRSKSAALSIMAVNSLVWTQRPRLWRGAHPWRDAHPRCAALVFDLNRLVRRRALEGADALGHAEA